ncbi:hypothetical protein IFM89_037843 [Coptis chinensis]|uniref:Myb-like domain-containing protein n=1 Tax=Coptis chinensis TaxID=261450 RepID=A0A835LSZ8_9MAGN|nr:hypothetical protein IFM89_037843 [Coptis chinensis]
MQQTGAGGGGGGGSQYGMTPEMTAFTTASTTASSTTLLQQQQQHKQVLDSISMLAEAASPISSRPPAARPSGNFEELAASGGFPDDEGFGGEEAERGGGGGNRWPRQETIALLKIRSEMDAAFRDATLKGPLWEDVSRKLAQLGYTRSAKKCKEKFENVHKYYKRTKEDPATTAAGGATTQIGVSTRISPSDLPIGMPVAGISFSSNTSDSDSDGSEDDLLEEGPSNTAGEESGNVARVEEEVAPADG